MNYSESNSSEATKQDTGKHVVGDVAPQYGSIEEVLFTHDKGFAIALSLLLVPVLLVGLFFLGNYFDQQIPIKILSAASYGFGIAVYIVFNFAYLKWSQFPAKTPLHIAFTYGVNGTLLFLLPELWTPMVFDDFSGMVFNFL